jgi:hypothetical protein
VPVNEKFGADIYDGRTGRDEFVLEAVEQFAERIQSGWQQPVRMPPLRDTVARVRGFGEMVAFDD